MPAEPQDTGLLKSFLDGKKGKEIVDKDDNKKNDKKNKNKMARKMIKRNPMRCQQEIYLVGLELFFSSCL